MEAEHRTPHTGDGARMMMMMRGNQGAFANFTLWILVVSQAILFKGDFLEPNGEKSENPEQHQEPWLRHNRSSLANGTHTTSTSSQPHIAWSKYDTWTGHHSWHPSWIGRTDATPTTTSSHKKGGRKSTLHNSMDKEQRLQLIEESFLRINHPHNHSLNTNESQVVSKQLEMLGFLRIPKTGSTAILTWAERATRKGPYWSCFFGSHQYDIFTDDSEELLGHFWNSSNVLECPHRTYEATVMKWATAILPSLNLHLTDTTAKRSLTVTQQQQQVSLQLFTILRDPFDRLVSYFHYVRRIYPSWSYASTAEQNLTILANNLTGWMELLATQPPKAFHLPYQKGAMIDIDDFPRAIAMIQSPVPRVYTVIQECFEASVLLLAEKFPQFFSLSETTKFLNSSKTKQNKRGRFQKVHQETLTKLKEQAEIWFAADFQFYEEAVHQFRRQLTSSNVDQGIVQECFNRLEKTAHR